MQEPQGTSQLVATLPLEKIIEVESSLLVIHPGTQVTDVLRRVAETTNSVLGGNFCVVQPYDQKTDRFLVEQFTAGGATKAEGFKWTEPRLYPYGAARTALMEGLLVVENYDEENRPFIAQAPGMIKGAFRDVADIKAALGIRLEVGGEWLGVLFVNYPEPHTFTDEEKRVARFFAVQAANAIHNARVYEREQKAHELAETLREVSIILTVPSDLPTVLELILKQLGRVVHYDGAIIGLVEGDTLVSRAAMGFRDKGAVLSFSLNIGEDKIFQQMLRGRRPIVIPDVRTDSTWKPVPTVDWVRSWVGAPLQIEDKVIGQIGLYKKEPDFYSEDDVLIIQAFVNQVAVAVRTATLFEETSKYADSRAKLLEIAQTLTSAITEPELVLQETIQRTVKLLDVTRGAIILYENGAGRLVAAFDTRFGTVQSGISLRFPDSPLQQKVRSAGYPIMLVDVATDTLLSSFEREQFTEYGIKSSLLLPLIARGRALGSIGLDETRYIREFSPKEQELAQILADLAAVAIDNSRIYGVAERELSAVILVAQNLMREALRPSIQIDHFLSYVMEQTLVLLEFDAGWLLLREGDWVKIVATDEHHRDDIGRSFLIEDCISGTSMLQKKTINIPDLANMPQEHKRVYKAPLTGKTTNSELVAPLMVGTKAIGAFNIESDRLAAFEPRHAEMLRLLSDHVALAIELARSREEAAAFSRIGLDLSRETEMDAVVRSVLRYALRLVHRQLGEKEQREQRGYGQVLLREGEKLVIRYTTNDPPTDLNMNADINKCVSGLAVLERKPIIVPNVEKPDYYVVESVETPSGLEDEMVARATDRPRYQRALEANKASMYAEFAVPLLANDVIIGVLNVETPRTSGFTAEQRESLTSFARSNAARFAETFLGQRDILHELLEGALVRTDTTFGQIMHLKGEELIIEQTTGGERIGTRLQVNTSVTGRAVLTGRPVYVPKVAEDPDYQRYLGEEMKSELAIPLLLADEVIGVLNVESPIPGFFTLEQAHTLETFAGQAAVAIDRAKRFEGRRLAEIGGLAGDIVHRLNNPIGATSMRLELFQGHDSYPKLLLDYPYVGNFVERTERDIRNAKAIIQELRTQLKGKEPGPTALIPAISDALSKAELPGHIKVRSLLPDQNIQVIANDRLINVFWNLFDNARKAMPSGGELTITADTASDDQWVIVRVQDTGMGIEPWRRDLVFELGETTAADSHAPARGYGLSWAKDQVMSFGGTIEVEDSKPGVGTCMKLKLHKAK